MLESLLNNDLLLALIAFGLVLIPAVIIHELGHFLAAKSVGITILEFGIGYPPRAFRLFRWGETEFTFNYVPLGGFVRPFGEDMIRPLSAGEIERQKAAVGRLEPSSTTPEGEPEYTELDVLRARGITPKSVNDVGPWARIGFLVAGALANILLAYVLFVAIGLIGVEQPTGGRVFLADITPDSMFAEAGLRDGDVIETVNGEYFWTSREFFRLLESYGNETVELSGQRIEPRESFTVLLPVDRDEAAALANAGGRLLVTTVQENSPANTAGILPGDVIVSLGGTSLATGDSPFETLRTVNLANEGKEIPIDLIREGEPLTLTIVPRVNPAAGIGHLGASVLTEFATVEGFTYGEGGQQFDYVPLPLGQALGYGAEQIGTILRMIADLPIRLISGQAQPEEGRVISIVGITQLGGEFLQQSIEEEQPIVILRFIALVSIALGITNLLPLPPLDGGRILFVVIEMVRGKPMSARREELLLMIGVVFLLSVGVLVIINDILNPITNSLNP